VTASSSLQSSRMMRSLFSPFSLLVCLLFVLACVTRNNYEEHEEKRRKSRKRRNFLVFGFAAFGAISLFLSLSLSFVSHIISLFSGEKNTPTRIISLASRMRRGGKLVSELCFGGGNKSFVSVVVSRFFLLERRSSLKKTSDVHLRRPHPALKNSFRTQTSAAAAATTDTTTATVCGFDCSRSLGDIGRRETRRKTHSASMAWTKDMNEEKEEEEKIEVPEGLKLNAVRMVKTAYETCAKANNYQTKEKGQEEMPNVISEATAHQFVRERIESDRESDNRRRREYLKAIAEDVKLASKLIALDFVVCKRALVEGAMTLSEVAEMAKKANEDHFWRKTVIRSVHEKLRDGAEANEEDLQQYSKAAAATGKSKWVKNALTWSFEFFEHYFGKMESNVEHDGDEDGRQYAKSRRKLITSLGEDVGKLAPTRIALRRGKRKRDGRSEGNNEETARVVEARNASIDRNRRYGRVNRSKSSNSSSGDGNDDKNGETFRLLDVGSCWDFYREYERKSTHFGSCKVVAFDLAPEDGAENVLEGDFLNVQFFDRIEDENGAETLLKTSSSSSSKRLEGLKLSSFNIVVLSLVLTYVPTPENRFQMIINARKCLKGDGDGLLMIIEPHGFDKSKENLVAKTWQKTIESVGFKALVNSKTRDGLHILIFETSSLPTLSDVRGEKLVMALDEEYKNR